jgi:hypothetical protein
MAIKNLLERNYTYMLWQNGTEVLACALKVEDRGFESPSEKIPCPFHMIIVQTIDNFSITLSSWYNTYSQQFNVT